MRLPWAVRNQSRLPEPQATGTVSAASLVHFDTRPLPSRAGSSYSRNCKDKPPAPVPEFTSPEGTKSDKKWDKMLQNIKWSCNFLHYSPLGDLKCKSRQS